MPPMSVSQEATTPRGYTSRYLSAVAAATNTVSSWLQGSAGEEVSPCIAAAAEQLRDEEEPPIFHQRTHSKVCS